MHKLIKFQVWSASPIIKNICIKGTKGRIETKYNNPISIINKSVLSEKALDQQKK